jgi:hypothetical protein
VFRSGSKRRHACIEPVYGPRRSGLLPVGLAAQQLDTENQKPRRVPNGNPKPQAAASSLILDSNRRWRLRPSPPAAIPTSSYAAAAHLTDEVRADEFDSVRRDAPPASAAFFLPQRHRPIHRPFPPGDTTAVVAAPRSPHEP